MARLTDSERQLIAAHAIRYCIKSAATHQAKVEAERKRRADAEQHRLQTRRFLNNGHLPTQPRRGHAEQRTGQVVRLSDRRRLLMPQQQEAPAKGQARAEASRTPRLEA